VDGVVVAQTGDMIDAFTTSCHVTLDCAFRCRRVSSRRGRQQDGLSILRHTHGTQNLSLRVSASPIPGCDKRAAPKANLSLASGALVRVVNMRVADERQRPSIADKPTVDIAAVNLTRRESSAVPIN